MSAKTRLTIIAILAACFVLEVRAQNGGLPPATRRPTTEGGGGTPIPTCAPSPKPGATCLESLVSRRGGSCSVALVAAFCLAPESQPTPGSVCHCGAACRHAGWLANATLLTQLAFWFGSVGLLVTLCATAVYFCCFSCEPVQVVRRQRRVHSLMSTEPLIPPATSGTNQRERRSIVRPVPVPAVNALGTAPTSTTYATVFPRLAPFGSPQVRPPGVPAATQSSRGGALSAWSPVLEPHREEDEFGYQAQTLQPYSAGLPAYSTVASTSFPFNPPGPGPQHPAAMGFPRSPPPPYSLQGYQQ